MVLIILDNFTIQVEEPLPVYRRALANAEDGSVAIASVSFFLFNQTLAIFILP